MRILLWAPFGAGTHYWGPGTSAYRLYKANKNPSIKVTLIHASVEQEEFPDVYHEQIKLPTLRGTGVIGKIKYILAATRWINKNYDKYDVIHGISAFEYTFRPMLQFAKLGKPVFIKITGEHGGFGDNSIMSKILGFSRNRIRNANKINGYIAISSAIKENLLRFNIEQKRILEIPNSVDVKRFKPLNEKDKIQLRKKLDIKDKFTFIYVGGLTYNKRIIEIVKAVVLLKEKGMDKFQFLIVGPDRQENLVENNIREMIKANMLADLVIRVPHTESPQLYFKAGDVFMLASRTEGMSNSLLEAMSCGLPSIVTDISGSQDLIEENVNGLFTTGEIDDIALKMEWCLNHQKELDVFGKNSRGIIEKYYSTDSVFNSHIKLFQVD